MLARTVSGSVLCDATPAGASVAKLGGVLAMRAAHSPADAGFSDSTNASLVKWSMVSTVSASRNW